MGLGAGVEVEGAAVGNVTRHLSKTGRGDRDVAPVNERGTLTKRTPLAWAPSLHKGFDEAAGRIDAPVSRGSVRCTLPSSTAAVARAIASARAVVAVSLVVQKMTPTGLLGRRVA